MKKSKIVERVIAPARVRSTDYILVNADGESAGVDMTIVDESGISKRWTVFFFWSEAPTTAALHELLTLMQLRTDNVVDPVGTSVDWLRKGPPMEAFAYVRDVEPGDINPIRTDWN